MFTFKMIKGLEDLTDYSFVCFYIQYQQKDSAKVAPIGQGL